MSNSSILPIDRPNQMLLFRHRLDLGAIKVYSPFPKAPALLKPHHQIGGILPLCNGPGIEVSFGISSSTGLIDIFNKYLYSIRKRDNLYL